MSRSWVIAGTFSEYQNFLANLPQSMNSGVQYCYVSSAQILYGLEDPHGYFYGTWMQRSDISDILTQLRVCTRFSNVQLNNAIVRWQKQRFQLE